MSAPYFDTQQHDTKIKIERIEEKQHIHPKQQIYFTRDSLGTVKVGSYPTTVTHIAWLLFDAMPSVNQLVIVCVSLGTFHLIIHGEPIKKLREAMDTFIDKLPLGLFINGHVVVDDEFKRIKKNAKLHNQTMDLVATQYRM